MTTITSNVINEMFKTLLITSDEGVTNWYLGLTEDNDLEIINNTNLLFK